MIHPKDLIGLQEIYQNNHVKYYEYLNVRLWACDWRWQQKAETKRGKRREGAKKRWARASVNKRTRSVS